MAYYSPSDLENGVLITAALIGETNFNFEFTGSNPNIGAPEGYFTFETLKNNTGSYANVTPLGIGDQAVGANSAIEIKPTGSAYDEGYIWSARVIRTTTTPANNVLTWTPATNVGVGAAKLRGTVGIAVNVV